MAATSEIDECFSKLERFKYEMWMTLHIYPGFVSESLKLIIFNWKHYVWLFSPFTITTDKFQCGLYRAASSYHYYFDLQKYTCNEPDGRLL